MMRCPRGRPARTHAMAIASRSRSHWVHVERARGLAVLVFLEEDSTLDYIHCQCNSCKSTGVKTIPGIGSLVTAASRAATAKKLEIFMATKEQTVTIDGLGERQTRGDRSIERAKKRLANSERKQLKKRRRSCWRWDSKRRETQTIVRGAY
jgi:hypothetical protein